MKKLILFSITIFLTTFSYSQSFEESIKDFEKHLNQKSYKEAIKKLNELKSEIENIYLIEIKSDLLPQNIEKFSVNNIEMSKSFISGNRVQINQIYVKPDTNEEFGYNNEFEHRESSISITISNFSEKICEVSNMHSFGNAESLYESESLKPIIFNDYRAAYLFNKEIKQGRFIVIIGGAVIEIVTENLESEKAVIEVANKIDIEKIIKYFGK